MKLQDQKLSKDASSYLDRITANEPRKVICMDCFKHCDCVLVSTQWKQKTDTQYAFRQVTQCTNCKGHTEFNWQHDFALGAAPLRKQTPYNV